MHVELMTDSHEVHSFQTVTTVRVDVYHTRHPDTRITQSRNPVILVPEVTKVLPSLCLIPNSLVGSVSSSSRTIIWIPICQSRPSPRAGLVLRVCTLEQPVVYFVLVLVGSMPIMSDVLCMLV